MSKYIVETNSFAVVRIPLKENIEDHISDEWLHLDLVFFWLDLKDTCISLGTSVLVADFDRNKILKDAYMSISDTILSRLGYQKNLMSIKKLDEKASALKKDQKLYHLAMHTDKSRIKDEPLLYEFLQGIEK